jgi:hypothetical protein
MKKVIRIGVFETNSSSTHSITMCSKDEYTKWSNGELFLDNSYKNKGSKFISKEDAINIIKGGYKEIDINDEDNLKELLRDEEIYQSPEEYLGYDLETFHEEYTTVNGEVVVAIGKYGYDG